MSFQKLEPLKTTSACHTCGCGAHDSLEMDSLLGVGFGDVVVTKDGEWIYNEGNREAEDCWLAKDAEDVARQDPDHDWRIHFDTPLYEAEYQRHGENHWVLIRKGQGFA